MEKKVIWKKLRSFPACRTNEILQEQLENNYAYFVLVELFVEEAICL